MKDLAISDQVNQQSTTMFRYDGQRRRWCPRAERMDCIPTVEFIRTMRFQIGKREQAPPLWSPTEGLIPKEPSFGGFVD